MNIEQYINFAVSKEIRKLNKRNDSFVTNVIGKRNNNIEIMKAWEPTILALESLQNFVDEKCPKAIGAAEDYEKGQIQAFLVELNNYVQNVNRKFEKSKTTYKLILKRIKKNNNTSEL